MMQGLTQIKNVNIVCVASDDARTTQINNLFIKIYIKISIF